MTAITDVVMYSGGIGSWMTARRIKAERGVEGMVLLFADVKGRHTDDPHVGEDEDTYRFIADSVAELGARLVTVSDGRSIWEVFHDDRFLGNTRLANCSKFLKQIPARKWLDENCDPDVTTVHVGIDWSETHRLPKIEKAYLPFTARAPMTEPPYLDKRAMLEECRAAGLEPPRLYAAGFAHNNCGGFCVRAGQGQMEKLYRENPERYAYAEAREAELADYLGKPVAVLRNRQGGTTVPLTLRDFRHRLESQPDLVDSDDIGGCGCFVD